MLRYFLLKTGNSVEKIQTAGQLSLKIVIFNINITSHVAVSSLLCNNAVENQEDLKHFF